MKNSALKVFAKPLLVTSILFSGTTLPTVFTPHAYATAAVSIYQSQMDSYTTKLVAFNNKMGDYSNKMDSTEDMDSYNAAYQQTMKYFNQFVNDDITYVNTLNPDIKTVDVSVQKLLSFEKQLLVTTNDWYTGVIDDATFENKIISMTKDIDSLDNELITVFSNYQNKYHVTYSSAFEDFAGHHFVETTNMGSYVVKKGDTLFKIAKSNEMSVQELKDLNGLKTEHISIGQVLKVNKLAAIVEAPSSPYYYTVQKGETLYKIAKDNGISVSDLKSINNLKSDSVSDGQVLLIKKMYTVQKGDTLYKIAKKNNITVDNLKRINHLTSDNISLGQSLLLN